MALHLQFDATQEHQRLAMEAVVRVFYALPAQSPQDFGLSDEIIPNLPPYDDLVESWLHDNVQAVQRANGLKSEMTLGVDEGMVLEGAGDEVWRYPSATLEMETGTGKTYVYLRTIHELRKNYGFSKFIIIVPSIAIFEGVKKTFEMTETHFKSLYGNEVVNMVPYESERISQLRTFATSTFCEILVMTLDAFNKKTNTIYKPSEKLPGERQPFQYIQETRPILILDEPQNMKSDRAKEALRTLHPLMALRYSATHWESPNLLYRLTPFQAFQQNLVKRIEVSGISEQNNPNRSAITLQAVVSLRASLMVGDQSYLVKKGDDLFEKTKREEFRDGYVVHEVNAGTGGGLAFVEFANGSRVSAAGLGLVREALFRQQIHETIERHMARQERLRARGIKVLSLFFIDKVASYTAPDGLIRLLFDEEFNKLKRQYPAWQDKEAADVREAYFAKKKTTSGLEDTDTPDVGEEKKTQEDRNSEKRAFELIMKKKEQLLGFGEPVSFIFAHSALKEGWDNPNVFQICTLNQTVSTMKKRQEIGRGLRICVDQTGARVAGDDVNVLTVVANASYKQYAEGLQNEYREDGDAPPPSPTDAKRAPAQRNDVVFEDASFRELWGKLSRPVTMDFNLDVNALVIECVNRLNKHGFTQPIMVVERGAFVQTQATLRLLEERDGRAKLQVVVEDSDGNKDTQEGWLKVGERPKNERLREFRVTEVRGTGDAAQVHFGNDVVLTKHHTYEVSLAPVHKPQHRETMAPQERYPVGDLIGRTARKTGLTRHTVRRIFQGMHSDKAAFLLANPEGFTADFIGAVSNALADHIAEQIQFTPGGTPHAWDLDMLFPPTKDFTQRELREAGPRGLYDQVQIDSDNEQNFVEILRKDSDKLVFYFKFPASFKVPLPAQIGNYNPDWGLARVHDSGLTLEYVRETKGSENIEELQFAHEKRKIRCALKYFDAIGVDYRAIKGDRADWYLSALVAGTFAL